MEQIASQKMLLPIIPRFLEKYKSWTARWEGCHLCLKQVLPQFKIFKIQIDELDRESSIAVKVLLVITLMLV